MKLSHSKIRTWKTCRQAYLFRYDLGLVSIPPFHVNLGAGLHHSLKYFYMLDPQFRSKEQLVNWFLQSMKDQWSALIERVGEPDPKDETDWVKHVENGSIILSRYWDTYGQDVDIPKSTTEVEIDVSITADLAYQAVIDAIVELDDGLWALEHKTGNPDVESLALEDEQSLLYCWALNKGGRRCIGTIYNILPSPGSTKEMSRLKVERVASELSTIEDEIKQIAGEILLLPRYPNRGSHCRWCDWRTLCRVQATGGDLEYLIQKFKGGQNGATDFID